MAGVREITASEFLQGVHRQSLLFHSNPRNRKSHLLWGNFLRHSRGVSLNLKCRAQLNCPRAVVSGDRGSSVVEQSMTKPGVGVFHLFRVPLIQDSAASELLKSVQTKISSQIVGLKTEQCFNIGLESELSDQKVSVLKWLLQETYEPENLGFESFLEEKWQEGFNSVIVEVGPRLSFTTAWSSNAVSICRACGLTEVTRMERSRRYLLYSKGPLQDSQINEFAAMVHDRMTECVYAQRLTSFEMSVVPEEVRYVPVMENGRKALEEINQQMGLAFDEQDLQYYTRLFREEIKRNPSTVELFDIAQSNSEHSRHWFFTGKIIIDGQPMNRTLMQIVKSTLQANPNNSVIGFKDNSSAIKGFSVEQLRPAQPGSTCPLALALRDLDVLFTAETHNFPCAVAPYPGAETGAGGRIRDTHATGRGSFVVASTAGYCVGNLNMEGSYAPWEDPSFTYPSNLASPLQILIDSSNGASDYGNKFGEPLIQGYTRTFGMRLPSGERREWLKPIMFSAGIGQIDHTHISKGEPDIGMLVVKIGGPAYRIGMGGGAASSMVSGQNDAELDFNAVQRGDAEMAQKLYRVVRACIEMGESNPIISIHDQGAGGNCNVVKEIIYPMGAEIDIRAIVVGDHTMSVLEIWGAEYQEQDAILVKPESRKLLESICERERVSMAVIGTINGQGRVVLVDSTAIERCKSNGLPAPPPAVDLELEKVLGDMPQKTFKFHRVNDAREPLDIAPGIIVMDALKRVLRLPSVCSKRFLTTKVDRCVTGLVAQQQTVGPLQITLSDVAVIAQTYSDITGGACAIGEQPIKGMLNPKAMARLAVGEALTNLVWAKVTSLSDVKASGNWMYAAKLDGGLHSLLSLLPSFSLFSFICFFLVLILMAKMSGTVMSLLFMALVVTVSSVSSAKFEELFQPSWAMDHFVYEGELLKLKLDNYSGAGFSSKNKYLFGKVTVQIKLIEGDSAGTVTAFYMSSDGPNHNEFDYEFLGNTTGEPYSVQTNIYVNGVGNREQRLNLWFDPTTEFHSYSIFWNQRHVVFMVDETPIRVYTNMEEKGIPFPKDQAMGVYSSIWNADDWATQGGRVKTDWSHAPFVASYKGFDINACAATVSAAAADGAKKCSSSAEKSFWWDEPALSELNLHQSHQLIWVRANHMFYDYCSDTARFPTIPQECVHHRH